MITHLFLDIDGVLAVASDRLVHRFRTFSPSPAAEFLRLLTAVPSLKLVISSSWRKTDFGRKKLDRAFDTWGLPHDRIAGMTGKRLDGARGLEIASYLKEHSLDWENIVVLDDETCDMPAVPQSSIVKVTFDDGLTTAAADTIIARCQASLINTKRHVQQIQFS